MGSPLSPVIANIYMKGFEEEALDTAADQPSMWLRYVYAIEHVGKMPPQNYIQSSKMGCQQSKMGCFQQVPIFSVQKGTVPFVLTNYAKVVLQIVTDRTQQPSVSRQTCFQRLLHIRKILDSFTNYITKVGMQFWKKHGFILLKGFHKLKCYFAHNPPQIFLV